MLIERRHDARGHAAAGWLDSWHTFSFGSYYDPAWMGFGPLRVINEDRVAPGGEFPPHRHANMEILSYVLDGALAHSDSSGRGGVIHAGDLQWMSAGQGVEHREFNASQTEPVHFLQIWLQPDRVNAAPACARVAAAPDRAPGQWRLLASPGGTDGSIAIRQDARLLGSALAPAATVEVPLVAARRYWLHVAKGSIDANGHALAAGDALGFAAETGPLQLTGLGGSVADVLLFDLPG